MAWSLRILRTNDGSVAATFRVRTGPAEVGRSAEEDYRTRRRSST
jgi:hypothetical protein